MAIKETSPKSNKNNRNHQTREHTHQLFEAEQSSCHQCHASQHSFSVLHPLQETTALSWHWPCHSKELSPSAIRKFLRVRKQEGSRVKVWEKVISWCLWAEGEGFKKKMQSLDRVRERESLWTFKVGWGHLFLLSSVSGLLLVSCFSRDLS